MATLRTNTKGMFTYMSCSEGDWCRHIPNHLEADPWLMLMQEARQSWMLHSATEHARNYGASSGSSSQTASSSTSPLDALAAVAGVVLSALSAERVRAWLGNLRRLPTSLSGSISSRRRWIVSVVNVVSRRGVVGAPDAYQHQVEIWPESFVCARCSRGADFDMFTGPKGGVVRMVHTCRDADDGLWDNWWGRRARP